MATDPDFQTLLGFTADDLATNRRGKLTEAQLRSSKQAARSRALGSLGLRSLFLLAAIILLAILRSGEPVTSIVFDPFSRWMLGVAVPGAALLTLSVFMVIALRDVIFPPTPTLTRRTGSIVRGNPSRRKGQYGIEINGRAFEIPKAAYDCIEAAEIYTIYTADTAPLRLPVYERPDNNTVLAMEVVDPAEAAAGKSPLEYQNERLCSIFHFTQADLVENRAGAISLEQIDHMSKPGKNRYIRNSLFQILIFAVIPYASTFARIGDITFVVVASGALLLLFVWMMSKDIRKSRAAKIKKRETAVSVAQGLATPRIIKRKRQGGSPGRTDIVYQVHIAHKPFEVSEVAYHAFKEGRSYAVYYIRKTSPPIIVAAEEIG